MKKQVWIFSIVAITVLISFATGAAAPNTFDANGDLCISGGTTPQEIGTPMELWAGVGNENAGTLVGYITFDSESVRINLTDLDGDGIPDMYPWVATAVHIHFAENLDGIPQTPSNNPKVGLFEYNIDDLELFEYIVEITDPFQSEIVIPVDFEAVGAIHVAVEKDSSDVDVLVEYLLNNFNVGDMIQPVNESCVPLTSCGAVKPEEALTQCDIDRAIAILTDDEWQESCYYCYGRVNALLCAVNDIQETAWGDGKSGESFDGNQWGTYFNYDETCGEQPEDDWSVVYQENYSSNPGWTTN